MVTSSVRPAWIERQWRYAEGLRLLRERCEAVMAEPLDMADDAVPLRLDVLTRFEYEAAKELRLAEWELKRAAAREEQRTWNLARARARARVERLPVETVNE